MYGSHHPSPDLKTASVTYQPSPMSKSDEPQARSNHVYISCVLLKYSCSTLNEDLMATWYTGKRLSRGGFFSPLKTQKHIVLVEKSTAAAVDYVRLRHTYAYWLCINAKHTADERELLAAERFRLPSFLPSCTYVRTAMLDEPTFFTRRADLTGFPNSKKHA